VTTSTTPAPSTLDAPIVAVTVYPDRARITRRGTIALSAGRHRVLVEPLPSSLDEDSIRVGGRGQALVLGVDVVQRRHVHTPDADAADLEKRRRELAAELVRIGDDDRVALQRVDFLTALGRRSTGTFARNVAEGGANVAVVSSFADGLASQLAAVYASRRALAEEHRSVTANIEAVDRRLHDLAGRTLPDRTAAAVDLEVTADGEVGLELSYLVYGGGWSSTYDLRLEGERLSLTWYGLIRQSTGEDWPECDLTLSTARPSRTAAVPELDPWYLDRLRPLPPAPPMMRSSAPGGMQPQAFDGLDLPSPGRAYAAAKIAEVEATVEQGVSAATYRTARPVAVPADGGTHRATITAFELGAELDYVTAPVTAPEAHLRATVTNTSAHTLLPGRAAVFTGGDFVGSTQLKTWAPGEEVELALGVDDRVRVEREVVGRKASKATLGSTRRREIEYRTSVANHTPGAARITVLDQVPVSRDEDIQVREARIQPAPAERTELGVLTWQFELAPGASAEVLVGVRVDLGKGVELLGWRE
jgi:uncharacterized protein (TIGR02231 family)